MTPTHTRSANFRTVGVSIWGARKTIVSKFALNPEQLLTDPLKTRTH